MNFGSPVSRSGVAQVARDPGSAAEANLAATVEVLAGALRLVEDHRKWSEGCPCCGRPAGEHVPPCPWDDLVRLGYVDPVPEWRIPGPAVRRVGPPPDPTVKERIVHVDPGGVAYRRTCGDLKCRPCDAYGETLTRDGDGSVAGEPLRLERCRKAENR